MQRMQALLAKFFLCFKIMSGNKMVNDPAALLAEVTAKINVINSLSPRPLLVPLEVSLDEIPVNSLLIELEILSSIIENIKIRLSSEQNNLL